jgi:hypothetical protein
MSASIGRTDRRIRPLIARLVASPVAILALSLALAAVAAGCVSPRTGATVEPTTGDSATLASDAPAVATATPTASANASLPTTTETAWGRIWDDLPAAFPVYPGAEQADGGQGPASALVAVPATVAGPAKVVAWYRQALVAAGYSIEALGGPMEDGGTVIDAVGLEPACRVQVTIGPRGSQTTVGILFAAACPFR